MTDIAGNGTLESKLGQLLIVGVPGTELTSDLATRLRNIGPAGVIFFAANFPDAPTAMRFTRAVHAVIATADLPALICADEEGGMVSQMSGFWEVPPSARAVSASGGPALVKDLAARTARRLLALGVNLNFAPVLDINSNPENPVIGVRSFGANASQVTSSGRAAIEGMQSAGVIPVVKHFPGHGDTPVDSHVTLPRVDVAAELLAFRELRPFEAAVKWGVPVVMTAHLIVPALDPDLTRTATTSRAMVTGLLRERGGRRSPPVLEARARPRRGARRAPPSAAGRASFGGADRGIARASSHASRRQRVPPAGGVVGPGAVRARPHSHDRTRPGG